MDEQTKITKTPVMVMPTNDALEEYQWEQWKEKGFLTKKQVKAGFKPTHILVQRFVQSYSRFSRQMEWYLAGAEFEAIKGAQHSIAKYRPGLAISAYHTPGDLWRLGLLINDLASDYDFHLRCHAYSSFETVLYAFPR